MFTNNENTRILVPKQVKDNSLDNEAPGSSEDADKPGASEVVACRVCLAVDGRLCAMSSAMQDQLAALTGVALSEERSLPRHLCVYCVAKLSKCAAFRDSCRRSTALLRTLAERGPLKMNDVKAINRSSHKLTNGLAWNKVFEFGTDPLLTVPPLIKTESEESSHEITGCIEVEYMGRDDSTKSDVESHTFEVPLEKHEITEIKLVKLKTESSNAHSDDDFDDAKVKSDSDIDSDTSDETIASLKRGKRKRIKLETESAKYTKKYKNLKSKDDPTAAGAKKKRLKKKVGIKSDARKIKKRQAEEKEPERKKFAYNCASCGKGFKKETTLFSHKPCYDPNTSAERIATIKKDTDVDFEKKYNFTIKLLSKEEQRQRIEEKKRNRSEFSCDVCGKDYVKESTLMAHKTFYHEPSLPFECDVCCYRFRSRAGLRKHQLDDRHRAVFTCNDCGKVSRNRTYAKEHYLMHKGTTYTCPYCQIVYERQSSYYGHIRLQHPGENEACDECGETFTGKVGLLVHKRMRHRNNDIPSVNTKCKVCEVTFLNAEALQKHTELSAGFGHAALWACAACGDSCGSEAARQQHQRDKHPPDQHYCKECDKTFSNASSFELHVERKHRNRRAATVRIRHGRIVCEICGKVFMCLTTLQYHMNVHLGLKPYQCPHCPKAFAQKTNLRLHMRVHTGERPYKCEQCPQAFAAQGNLIRHMKNVHLRVQVKCDTCGKMMGADSLSLHVRTVHLNQPYVRRKRNQAKKNQVLANEGGV